jgi:hypothetical protein
MPPGLGFELARNNYNNAVCARCEAVVGFSWLWRLQVREGEPTRLRKTPRLGQPTSPSSRSLSPLPRDGSASRTKGSLKRLLSLTLTFSLLRPSPHCSLLRIPSLSKTGMHRFNMFLRNSRAGSSPLALPWLESPRFYPADPPSVLEMVVTLPVTPISVCTPWAVTRVRMNWRGGS